MLRSVAGHGSEREHVIAAALAGRIALAVVDPLGPVDQDPDAPRDAACDLTASDSVCSPPVAEPRDIETPSSAPNVGSAGSGLGTIVVVLLVVALIAILVWLVVLAMRHRGELDDDADIDDLDEDLDDVDDETRIIDEERPPDRWRSAAEEHRAAGRFRDAVRCEYRALVGDLARAGLVDEIPGRTSGEERMQLRSLATDIAPAFDAAADIFDGAWFDDGEVTPAHWDRFLAAEREVLDVVLAGARRRSRSSGSSTR